MLIARKTCHIFCLVRYLVAVHLRTSVVDSDWLLHGYELCGAVGVWACESLELVEWVGCEVVLVWACESVELVTGAGYHEGS